MAMFGRVVAAVGVTAALGVGPLVAVAGAQESPPTVFPTTLTQPSPTTTVAPQELPRTGTDIGPLVIVGAGLTAAGTVLVVSARRRRIQPAAAA